MPDLNDKIYKAALTFKNKKYYPNGCANAVFDMLMSIGIDVRVKYGVTNNLLVPAWQDKVGIKIDLRDIKPGDLVFTGWEEYDPVYGSNTWGHIGVSLSKETYIAVSTDANYYFVECGIPFSQPNVMARRITTDEIIKSDIIEINLFLHDGLAALKFNAPIEKGIYDILAITNGICKIRKRR